MPNLSQYLSDFSSLHTAVSKGKPAPHKALLLLAVLDMVEDGSLPFNRIVLTDALVRRFDVMVKRYLGNSTIFRPNIGMPYFHMQHEPFWELVPAQDALGMVAEDVAGNKRIFRTPSTNYSQKSLRENFAYARLDADLFQLMQNPDAAAKLRVTLISKYLVNQPTTQLPLPSVSLAMLLGTELMTMLG